MHEWLQPKTPLAPPQANDLVGASNAELNAKDTGKHFDFDPKTQYPMLTPGFAAILEKELGLNPDVVNQTLKLVCKIATECCW